MFLIKLNRKKVISILAGTALLFTTAGMSISHAGIVADNSSYHGTSGYSSGYSLSRNISSSTDSTSSAIKIPTSTSNNNTGSTSTNNTPQEYSTNSEGYYYISPYSSSGTRSNSYSISNLTSNQGATTQATNDVTQDNPTYTQETNTTQTNNNIVVDNSNSINRSNTVSLSQATSSPSTEELPKLTTEEVLDSQTDYKMTYEKEKLLELINKDRVAAGLQALKIEEKLFQIAQLKSQDMYDYSYFSHTSPNFGRTSSLIRLKGISYFAYGENIGRTQSVYSAHNGFMNSDGHRANIMNPRFTHIGIGIVGNYYTEVFIGK